MRYHPASHSARQLTRRDLLKAAAAAALAAPQLVPSSVLGAHAPSNRINVGVIGCGNQSTVDLPAFLQQDDAQVLCVCDVNFGSCGYKNPQQRLGRSVQREYVDKFYAQKQASGQYHGCEAYSDFRDVVGRKDIDAVVIIVPDHWHALMTVAAAKAGKDIYCEKPLSLCVAQGQAMIKAVRQYHRILQVGSMYRSSPEVRRACELVRNGRIGQVKRIYSYVAPNNAVSPGPGWKPMPVPAGFDYETWLGPAPAAPYHEDRCFYRFRFIQEYSGGQTTNFGAHANDIAQWAMGADDGGPVEFEDFGAEFPPKGSLFTTATKVSFRARYANGVELLCATAAPTAFGTRFEGTEGWIQYGYKGVHSEPASLAASAIGQSEIHLPESVPGARERGNRYYVPDHVRNFLDAVKSRKDPISPVEAGHHTANLCHLGNIAMLLKRKIRWDPQKEQILGDDEASAMLTRPMRKPWQLD